MFDATGAAVRPAAGVLVEDGVIRLVGRAGDGVPEGADVVDLAGRTLMPGLTDAHAHVIAGVPAPADGAEPLWPGTAAHLVAAALRESLRMGITTLRDVGSYADDVVTARQATRYGTLRGPRLLTCGRIGSATSPGAGRGTSRSPSTPARHHPDVSGPVGPLRWTRHDQADHGRRRPT